MAAAYGHNRKSFPSYNAYTLFETAELIGVDPRAWLSEVRDRSAEHKIPKLDELMPWRYAEASA
ncbi:MAG: transposase domain-containing protein [Alphaproteobacteria bacterium]|nr:transposase domain-containing protein [Alphaproteobacteria bacterium]